MLTVLIGLVAAIPITAGIANGEWGVVGVAVAILLLLMLMSGEERKDRKAYVAWREHWEREYRRKGRR